MRYPIIHSVTNVLVFMCISSGSTALFVVRRGKRSEVVMTSGSNVLLLKTEANISITFLSRYPLPLRFVLNTLLLVAHA